MIGAVAFLASNVAVRTAAVDAMPIEQALRKPDKPASDLA
jgi:hypothetical protein